MRTCSSCGAVFADTTGSDCPVCHAVVEAAVIPIDSARRKRDKQEEQRLEQLVIARWTGKDEDHE